MLPIILNFFGETFTFKKMDSKTFSSKTDKLSMTSKSCSFLTQQATPPPTIELKFSLCLRSLYTTGLYPGISVLKNLGKLQISWRHKTSKLKFPWFNSKIKCKKSSHFRGKLRILNEKAAKSHLEPFISFTKSEAS